MKDQITERIQDREVTLRVLTLDQLDVVRDKVVAYRRKELDNDFKSLNLTPGDKLVAYRSIGKVQFGDLSEYASTPAGAREIVRLASENEADGNAVLSYLLLHEGPYDIANLAMSLMGMADRERGSEMIARLQAEAEAKARDQKAEGADAPHPTQDGSGSSTSTATS